MTEWDPDTLAQIAATDDLHIAPFREDGTTCGTPTWIWSVVVTGTLYVRPWNGANSRWYKAAMSQGRGVSRRSEARSMCVSKLQTLL